ncbi:MAG: hypothetical protein ABIJ91_03645 [Candidatus Kuenenbacteria bacterium]
MALNLILEALKQFGDGFQFERLCNDIMHTHYKGFKPGGHVHDLGIDGLLELKDEEDIRLYFKQSTDKNQIYVFQYSIQETWETKIKKTLEKLNNNNIEYDRLIYVTNQNPTISSLTKIQLFARTNFQKSVDIFSQEFLRMYLEAPANSHLVDNYFASYLYQLKRWGIETSIFANVPLSENFKRRALVLLSTCVRSPEGQEVKNNAAIEMIIGCIYNDDGRRSRSKNDIISELQNIFGDNNLISDDFINIIILKLIKEKRIIENNNKYILSEKEIDQIESKIQIAYNDDSSFYNSLFGDIDSLRENQKKQIRFTIAKGIGNIFERKGIEIANTLCDCNLSLSLNDYPEINIIARDVSTSLDKHSKDIATKIITELFTNPTDFQAEYLYGIAESYLVYACFNLDPDTRFLDLESARENVLIIDTDILLQTFIGNEKLQELYKRLLNITKNMGITMYTLPQMIHEFVYKISRSHEDYVYINKPARLTEDLLNDLGDVFIYYFKRILNTGRTWDQFIASLIGNSRDINAKEKFVEDRLEKEYGILCKDFKLELSLDKNELKYFAEDIIRSRTSYQTYKHEDLCESDAVAALTIDKLQDTKDGKQYWLLSNDNHLCKVWQKRTKHQKVRFFPTQNWYQYIINHPASKSKPVDFSVLMKSLSVSPSRPRIPRNLLLTLIRFGVNVSKFTTDALIELNKRLYSDQLWQQVMNKRSSEISNDEIQGLEKSLDKVLTVIEEDISPERVKLRDKIKINEVLIKNLASEKLKTEKELEQYKEKEGKRKKYNKQMKNRKRLKK